MSLNQMLVAVVEAWEKISPEIIKRSFVVVGQVPDQLFQSRKGVRRRAGEIRKPSQAGYQPSRPWESVPNGP